MDSSGAVVCHHTTAEVLVIFSGMGPAITWGSVAEEALCPGPGQERASKDGPSSKASNAVKSASPLLISPGAAESYVALILTKPWQSVGCFRAQAGWPKRRTGVKLT